MRGRGRGRRLPQSGREEEPVIKTASSASLSIPPLSSLDTHSGGRWAPLTAPVGEAGNLIGSKTPDPLSESRRRYEEKEKVFFATDGKVLIGPLDRPLSAPQYQVGRDLEQIS